MKKMKKIFVKSCLFSLLLVFSGCNDWLDIKPTGVQSSDTYWQTKEEAEQVLMSAYIQLRDCHPSFFKWGELRAGALEFGMVHSASSDQATDDERLLRMLDIRPSNSLCDWSEVYTAIGRANSVIKFAPKALETDATFSRELCNSYIAEAIFIRSLCYFYLVRTFRDVPYVTDPFADDSKTFLDSISSGNDILNLVIKDLEGARAKPGYEVTWQTKGRATSWAIYALMADIYLWQGRYSDVRLMYQKLKLGGFSLAETEDYFTLFYPGNNPEESIFELQFRDGDDFTSQNNQLFEWFQASTIDGRYIVSDLSKDIIGADHGDEIRGEKYMYDGEYTGGKYFKYLGTADRKDVGVHVDSRLRGEKDREPNWIFYRFADIVLMEAEAMVQTGVPHVDVCVFLDSTIRKRAGLTTKLTVPGDDNKLAMYTIILDERLKEFMAEGKRWFDILRIARNGGDYKFSSILIDELCRSVPSKDQDMWRLRLLDEYGHYLPISKSEIEASYGNLPQNPFYKNIE